MMPKMMLEILLNGNHQNKAREAQLMCGIFQVSKTVNQCQTDRLMCHRRVIQNASDGGYGIIDSRM